MPSLETCTLLLFAGLVLSLFSYYVIETPIRKNPIKKSLSLVLSLCVIGCAAMGIMVRNKGGFPSRAGENAVVAATMSYVFPSNNEYEIKNTDAGRDLLIVGHRRTQSLKSLCSVTLMPTI